jgi:hypothetical protein
MRFAKPMIIKSAKPGHTEKAKSKVGSNTDLLMKPYTHAELAQRVRSLHE